MTDLVVLSRGLGELESALEAVSEEETAEVVRLGSLDQLLDLGLVEMSRRERLGGAELRAERAVHKGQRWGRFLSRQFSQAASSLARNAPVVAIQDNSAGAGRLVLDDLVSRVDALAVVGGAELLGERVGTDGAEVRGRVLGENVLSECGRVSMGS